MQAKVVELLWGKFGEYQLNTEASLPSEAVGLEMSTTALIYEGARLCFDDERLRARLGDVDHLHVGLTREAADPSHKLGLGDEERRGFAAIDGRETVAQLKALELLKESELDRLLYAMKCTQMVRLRPG